MLAQLAQAGLRLRIARPQARSAIGLDATRIPIAAHRLGGDLRFRFSIWVAEDTKEPRPPDGASEDAAV